MALQQNAWMDFEIMKQYISSLPEQTELNLLIMDHFSAHLDEEIVPLLTTKNYLRYVPKEMTDLLQTLDVGIFRPFKNDLRYHYLHWQTALLKNGENQRAPSKSELVGWIKKANEDITFDVIQAAFSKCAIGLSDFANAAAGIRFDEVNNIVENLKNDEYLWENLLQATEEESNQALEEVLRAEMII